MGEKGDPSEANFNVAFGKGKRRYFLAVVSVAFYSKEDPRCPP